MTACLACLAFAMSGAAGPAEAPPSPPSSERPANVAPRRRSLPPVIPPLERPALLESTVPPPTPKAPAVRPPDPAGQRLDPFVRGVLAVLIVVSFILLGMAVAAYEASQERRRVARGGRPGVVPLHDLLIRVPPP